MEFVSATAMQALQVLVAALVLGAGLPALFALGLRVWSPPSASAGNSAVAAPVIWARRAAAIACFAVLAAAIVAGIGYLVFTGHRG